MGKIETKIINRFDLGMTNILRSNDIRFARTLKHFDILTDPTRLNPYRSLEADAFDSGLAASTIKLCKMLSAKTSAGTATQLYGLGVDIPSADTAVMIYEKSTIGGSWVSSSGNAGTAKRNEKVFVEYKGSLYGWRSDAEGSVSGTLDGSTSEIWRHQISNGVFTDAHQAINSATYVAQGLVHSKDDILYMPYDNVIAKNNNGSWTTAAITLPDNLVITSIAEWGNYLAIGCRSKFPYNTNSIVFLWDRDSSLTTLSEKIDFGPENLELIEVIDGIMVAVCTHRNTFSEVLTIKPRLVFKYWDGGPQAKQFMEFELTSNTVSIDSVRQKLNNRVLFFMSVELDSNRIDAIWSIARTPNGMSVTIDTLINNDTAVTSCAPKGFFKFGDYMHVGFTDNGTYKVMRTNNDGDYTATSVYETLVLNFDDPAVTKKLLGVTVSTEPLPTAGQIVLKYKKDAETSFTTIFTHTTDDSISHSAINIESSGANLPEFKEITLRIESTGGAVVTGLKLKAELMDKDLY